MIDTGISIEQFDEWNELRHKDITSSDVSALFGHNPYISYYGMWHRKKAPTPPHFEATEAMEWGNELEPVVASVTARKNGLIIRPKKTYCRHDTLQAGSSFDYEIIGTTPESPYRADFEKMGNGILEIKTADFFAFKNTWKQEEGHDVSPYVEIQVQHQLMISGLKWGLVGALVGGNRGHVVKITARADVHQAMEIAIEKFWLTQYANEEPHPDYKVDSDFILSRHNNPNGEKVYMDDPVIDGLVRGYLEASKQEKRIAQEKKTIQAQIVEYVGDLQKVTNALGTWKVSRSLVAGKPDSVITEDMVGQVVKGRKAYTTFSVTGE